MGEVRRAETGWLRDLLLIAGLWVLVLACAADHVDRARWQSMSADDRTLYVKTLIAEQQSKQAKGGDGLTFSRPAEEYAKRIDDAYAGGDTRSAEEIFESMGAKR